VGDERAASFDPDRTGSVDHHFADSRVGEEMLQWSQCGRFRRHRALSLLFGPTMRDESKPQPVASAGRAA
jgi:hypothetical protein